MCISSKHHFIVSRTISYLSTQCRWDADMDWRSWGEDNISNGNLIGPGGSMRHKPLGVFRNNKAHSNYWQGFRLHHFEQFFQFRNDVDVPIFEGTMAYRNREHGIYAYSKSFYYYMIELSFFTLSFNLLLSLFTCRRNCCQMARRQAL